MAVTDVLAIEEFVDLYKILEIPSTSNEAELRERVNKLYLEAQRNIDHHNFRKRFYYQQLYEVHLPQAHQLLLDPARRAEYDQYLEAFNKGLPFPTETGTSATGPTSGDLGRTDRLDTEMLPAMNPAANAGGATLPGSRLTAPGTATPPATPATTPKPAIKAPTPARPVNKPAPKPFTPSPAVSSQRSMASEISEAERRRDYKRRELIKSELESAGQTWGISMGTITFIVIITIAYFLGQGNGAILGSGVGIGLALGVIAGRQAVRMARRNIVADLSKMPYDELLRRCAR